MSNVSMFCFLASYLVAFGLEMARVIRRISMPRFIILAAGVAGLIAHTFYLFAQGSKTGMPPLLSSTRDWMLVLAWLVIVSYLTLTVLNRRLPVGVFLLPVVLILIGAAYFVSDLPNEYVTPKGTAAARDVAINNWAMLHATLLVFGITGVVVGFVLSMMYVVQHRRLKHRQPMVNNLALPSLERLARLNRYAVIISIPLLTLGMLCGLIGLWSRKGLNPVSFVDPVVLTSSVVWLVMIVFLVWLLATKRPVGKQVAWITIWAFGFLLVTLIGLEVLTGGHRRPSPLGTHNRQFRKYRLRTIEVRALATDGNQNTKSLARPLAATTTGRTADDTDGHGLNKKLLQSNAVFLIRVHPCHQWLKTRVS